MELSSDRVMSLKKRIKRAFNSPRGKYYAQYAEDIIIKNWLDTFYPNEKYFYIDIGCGRSKYTSNTWLLYKNGANGYCYDANYKLCKRFKKARPRDTVINAAVTSSNQEYVDFYILNLSELSTINQNGMKAMIKQGFRLKKTVTVPTISIEQILRDVNRESIDLLSLDVEGNEYDIIKKVDFQLYKIKVICIEVVDYKTGKNDIYVNDLIRFMEKSKYSIIGNTGVNLLFALNDLQEKQ